MGHERRLTSPLVVFAKHFLHAPGWLTPWLPPRASDTESQLELPEANRPPRTAHALNLGKRVRLAGV